MQSHPWKKHMGSGPHATTNLNDTMHSMWKVVQHHEHGEGHQFNPYDQGMPNITVGRDERWLMFKALKGIRGLLMIVHNQFDLQDSQILYGNEKIQQTGERRYTLISFI